MGEDKIDRGDSEFDTGVTVQPFKLEDLHDLRGVLESAVVMPPANVPLHGEIREIMDSLEQSLHDNYPISYFVAQNNGRAVGMMGLAPPNATIKEFAATERPIEIVNAYVDESQRGSGVGRQLVRYLESVAKERGFTEVVLNSGPRYQQTGWPFWRRMYGEPAGVAEKYYDGEWDARVWRHEL